MGAGSELHGARPAGAFRRRGFGTWLIIIGRAYRQVIFMVFRCLHGHSQVCHQHSFAVSGMVRWMLADAWLRTAKALVGVCGKSAGCCYLKKYLTLALCPGLQSCDLVPSAFLVGKLCFTATKYRGLLSSADLLMRKSFIRCTQVGLCERVEGFMFLL